ncbi:MAG: sodium/proline symporter PutP [Clostridia bacterium]|nr:sodium/proline symporter PutP [Clostridia bacterium]MBR3553464.1 sodium/proline symporter PutP [Clostridia bacterium]
MNGQLFAFILYFALVIGIGLYFFFRTRGGNEKDYFLGGRSMGPWVTAMSAQASDMSGWLLMGFPGSILAFGMGKVWIGIGLALGTALNWIFMAKRLRNFSAAADDAITLPQYLKNRFAAKNNALQIICAIVFLVFFTLYVASSFVAGKTVLQKVIPQLADKDTLALGIFALIIVLYTFTGGFKAVCWTDFFQGMLMLVALLAVPIIVLLFKDPDMTKLSFVVNGEPNNFNANPFTVPWQEIVTGLGWGLGYFGMPHIIVRFMAIKKASMVKKSATVAIIWVVLSLGAAIAIAILGRTFAFGQQLVADGAKEKIFIEFASELFPPFVAGLVLSAIVAAAMSTADSQLLVASSSFTSDIYKPVFRKNASDTEVLWIGRIVVALVAVVAFVIAKYRGQADGAIMKLVDNAWAGFGSAFGPVILLSLFWRRMTYSGAIAGVVGGAAMDVAWRILLTGEHPVLAGTGFFNTFGTVYEIVPGFLFGLICCVAVSLIGKNPPKEVEEIFDRAVAAND